MASVDLKEALHGFFGSYLMEQRANSPHTIKSYRDSLKLLLEFARNRKGSPRIKLAHLDVPIILDFLKSLESSASGRGNSTSTRNYRLAAIHSFFKYLSWQYPSLERQAKKIRAIPIKKSFVAKRDFLTREELKILFAQVDTQQSEGFRDLALLTYLYNTGARSQEAANTRISWLDFSNEIVTITGKGNKDRLIPLWATTIKVIETYLKRYRRRPKSCGQDFVFVSQRGEGLTRFGVWRIVQKYLRRAKPKCKSLRSKQLSTHSLRNTCAMHLLESGVEVNVLKTWLGHADLSSTSRYIDADLSQKRKALKKFGPPIYVASSLERQASSSTDQILSWLNDL